MKPDITIFLDHGAHDNRPRLQICMAEPISNDVCVYESDTEAFEAATAIARVFQKFGKVVSFVAG